MLKIKLGTLRRLVHEEVERNMRWSAGMAPGGVGHMGKTTSPGNPLPGLGPEESEEDLDAEPEYIEGNTKRPGEAEEWNG